MSPVIDRPHWSYSSINQYLRCPLQFYFERVLKLPRATMPAARALGSAVHAALADYHRTLRAKADVDPRRVRDVFLEAWGRLERDHAVVHKDGSSREEGARAGLALIEAYLREPPPRCIRAVEEPLLVPIATSDGDVLERPLLVVPDLVTAPDDREIRVHEIKTSGRAYSELEVATSLQATAYALALHEATGEEPTVEFAVLVKTKTPRVQRMEAIRAVPDFRRLGDLVRVVERAVESELFYPQESPLNCSGCPYYRPCREWAGPGGFEKPRVGLDRREEALACSPN